MIFQERSKHKLKVADEAFIVTALMHQEHPEAVDFSVSDLAQRARELDLTGSIRPGLTVHFQWHCVANLAPNPGRYRMLFQSGKARRRLLLRSDAPHPSRNGKIFPNVDDVPPELQEVVNWAKKRYFCSEAPDETTYTLLNLRGSGKLAWANEHADAYVDRLREDFS